MPRFLTPLFSALLAAAPLASSVAAQQGNGLRMAPTAIMDPGFSNAAMAAFHSFIPAGWQSDDGEVGGESSATHFRTPLHQHVRQQSSQDEMLMRQLRQMAQVELEDYGIRPTRQLYAGSMHGPTPTSIPGARVVTTADLFQYAMSSDSRKHLVFDVLGGSQTLPNAISAVQASQPGSFNDELQQSFGQFLQRVTRGRQDTPMVFYCASTHCWMSYNAALRAVNLGYRNVMWYRGGIEAWSSAGFPTQAAGDRTPGRRN